MATDESPPEGGRSMRWNIARAVILGLLLGGLARADSGWREIRGPHVLLRTDLGSGAAREAATIHGLSWVMVHWLYNEHSDQFAQLQGLLARGIDPDKAWKIILPDLKTPDLDVALNQYLSHGNYQEYLAPFTDPRPPLEEIPLSEADVLAERARVAVAASRSANDRAAHQEEAQRELAKAFKLDPTNANALVLRFELADSKDRPAIARKLTEAHPQDGRGWLLLGQALGDEGSSAEREAAFRKAVTLRPEDPRALNNLAWLQLQQGKASEAAPLITRAIQIAPYDPSLLDTLAAV
jgi:tetratricopeptide (TPR) repeat protein